jgi:hypothetical protein
VHVCDCPSPEACTFDPYTTGGPPMKDWEFNTIEELINEVDKKVPS